MTLSDLILELGGPFAASVRMKCTRRAIDYWVKGEVFPNPKQLIKLWTLSGGTLCVETMFLKHLQFTNKKRRKTKVSKRS